MKRILKRLIILIICVLLYLLISLILFPKSQIGIFSAIDSVKHFSGLNQQNWINYLIIAIVDTLIRFLISICTVGTISFFLIFYFHRTSWGISLLDHFSESLRTIPATAWAYPLAILPFITIGTVCAFYVAIVLSTTPVLVLGILKKYLNVYNSTTFKLALKNKIDRKRIIRFKFYPWIAIESSVQFKTTFALIFIIIIVLEDVLQGGSIKSGLGVMIGNFRGSDHVAAELFMLVLLSIISITIASIVDIIEHIVKGPVE
jgi:ABC-type nitrate/sulfonate/bicarbonate transport system permease component